MGNRAVVVFTDGTKYSPATYLHWGGSSVPRLLAATRERMRGREGDLSYTAARFVGIAHEDTDGNTSLGMWNVVATKPKDLEGHCPGDAGVFLVNVNTWKVVRVTCDDNIGECDAPPEWVAGEPIIPTAEQGGRP